MNTGIEVSTRLPVSGYMGGDFYSRCRIKIESVTVPVVAANSVSNMVL